MSGMLYWDIVDSGDVPGNTVYPPVLLKLGDHPLFGYSLCPLLGLIVDHLLHKGDVLNLRA